MPNSSYFDQDSVSKVTGNQYEDIAGNPFVSALGFARGFASKVRRKYAEADRALKGLLPGGGTPNPLIAPVGSTIRNLQEGAGNVSTAIFAKTLEEPLRQAGSRILHREGPTSSYNRAKEITKNISSTLKNPVTLSLTPPGVGSYYDPTPNFRSNPFSLSRSVFLEDVNPNITWNFDELGKPTSTLPRDSARVSNATLLHELGHARNFEDPFWGRVQGSRNRPANPTLAGASGIVSSALRDDNNPPSIFAAGLQGALANMLTPHELPKLAEEAAASVRAANMARAGNIPMSKSQLIGAWGTYAARPATTGFAEGVLAEAGMRGVDWLSDRVSDFLADRRDPTNLEKQLEQYGFDKNQYRLQPSRTPLGLSTGTLGVEKR